MHKHMHTPNQPINSPEVRGKNSGLGPRDLGSISVYCATFLLVVR